MPRNAPGLSGPFSTREGRAAGLTGHDLRADGWSRPFVGVRSFDEPETVADLARAYVPKMHPAGYFSHTTAALLYGMRLPPALQHRLELHVSVPPGVRAPRDRLVKGRTLVERPGYVRTKDGLRLAQPWEVWCQLATILGMIDLIVAGESLLAKGRRDRLALDALAGAVAAGDRPRQAMLNRALPQLRAGSRSAEESELRLMIVADGLPEPKIDLDIDDGLGRWIGEFDLVWRAARLVVEYDGEGRFIGTGSRRNDIRRQRLLEANGWKVIRVMKDDLAEHPDEILAEIRAALAARS